MKKAKVFFSVLVLVAMVGIVNAATVTEDFESYTPGTFIESSADWYATAGEGGEVGAATGLNGTQGIAAADDITTRIGTPAVTWNSLSVGDSLVISMDFQADDISGDAEHLFNDDRLGMMAQNDNMASSSHILAAQLEDGEIWFYEKESDQHQDVMVADFSDHITAGAWYNFVVSITKEGDTSFTISGTVSEIGGTWSDTGSLFVDDSDSEFFGDTDLFPAFKNFLNDGCVAAADNFSFTVGSVAAHSPEPTGSAVNPDEYPSVSWYSPQQDELGGLITDSNIVEVTGYDVWWSVDEEPNYLAVYGAIDYNPPMYQDAMDQDRQSFDPTDEGLTEIVHETTYYWRVDSYVTYDSNEITKASTDAIVEGATWQFATIPPYWGATLTMGNNVLTTVDLLDITPAELTATATMGSDPISSVIWSMVTTEADYPSANMDLQDASTYDVDGNLDGNPSATFAADIEGVYVVKLVISDETGQEGDTQEGLIEIKVYADNCQAAKDAGDWEADYYDVTGPEQQVPDCVVDLLDFAEFAKNWMDDTSMQEQANYDQEIFLGVPPVSFTGSYSEDFDGIGADGTEVPAGWATGNFDPDQSKEDDPLSGNAVTSETLTVSDGTLVEKGMSYNYGNTGDSNRAIGNVCTSSSGDRGIQLVLTNDTPAALDQIDLSYAGEQWLALNSGSDDPGGVEWLKVYVSFDSTSYTHVDDALDFSSLQVSTANGTEILLDGNLAANRTEISGTIDIVDLLNASLGVGERLYITWFDENDPQDDHGLAIDDVVVSVD